MACLQAVDTYFQKQSSNNRPLYERFAEAMDKAPAGAVVDYELCFNSESREDLEWTTARFSFRHRLVEILAPSWDHDKTDAFAHVYLFPVDATWDVIDNESGLGLGFDLFDTGPTKRYMAIANAQISAKVHARGLLRWLNDRV